MPSYPALCPPCGGRAASLGAQNSPSGREDICRSRTARGAGIDGRFPTFLRTCAGIVACSAGTCNDQATQDIEPLCMLSWRFVALAQCSQWSWRRSWSCILRSAARSSLPLWGLYDRGSIVQAAELDHQLRRYSATGLRKPICSIGPRWFQVLQQQHDLL